MIYRLFFFVLLMLISVPVLAGDDVPTWLLQDVKAAVPSYEIKNVPAVILRNEQNLTVDNNGRVIATTNYAVRILTREGRDEALAHAIYNTKSEKVRDFNAWLIRANGQTKKYQKNQVADVSYASNDVYQETRLKVLSAKDETDVGDVFGFQTVIEENDIFNQFPCLLQERLPVLQARCSLTLPSGWVATSITFNHANIAPANNGTTYTWQAQNLSPIRPEPMSPNVASLAPRIAINYFPSDSAKPSPTAFKNWKEVAGWLAALEDPQMKIDDNLAAKAKELTANSKTELEKIQAIGRYVQNIQYISIQTGIGNGGGYIPHAATEVFAKSYGDCKDKANLMRAMLSVLKINSYMVSIYSGDAYFVRAEWASPSQFNHCIIAIKVSDATISPAIAKHPTLGRLLIFDATDPYTPVGDLPDDEQGSLALIDQKDTDALLVMPVMPPEMNLLKRDNELTLTETGAMSGTIRERATGQRAVSFRAEKRTMSTDAYNESIADRIASGANGAKITKITPSDKQSEGSFDLDIEFNSPSYAQVMQNRLLVFKPTIVNRRRGYILTDSTRLHPVVLDSRADTETTVFNLPKNFAIDEMPEAAKIETAFGKYSTTYEVKDDKLIFTRNLTIKAGKIPVEQYKDVRNFYAGILAAEQAPVVLVKK